MYCLSIRTPISTQWKCGAAPYPDSVMRYLNENPWDRLEKIHAVVGDVSKLTALSRGRNLFGYAPYTDEIIEGFSRNAIESGLASCASSTR